MVRKVGFGNSDAEPTAQPKKSIADQAMDRFRARAKVKAAREAQRKAETRGKAGRVIFLIIWLIIWIAISGSVIFNFASGGLNASIVPLVIWTAASVFVVSKVLKKIIGILRGDRSPGDRPDNF